MSRFSTLVTAGVIASLMTTALANPALPAGQIAADAANRAQQGQLVAIASPNAAQLRQQGVQQAKTTTPQRGAKTAVLRATAYNSLPNQTDSTPFITATGTRTRFGVVALSRDLLKQFPYGTKIIIEDLTGKYNDLLRGQVFIVEDTMNKRKVNSIDIWMSSYRQAMQFGARSVRITVVN